MSEPIAEPPTALDAALEALERGEPGLGWARLEPVLARPSGQAAVWSVAGLCARLLGDDAGAERCWTRALALDPLDGDACDALVRLRSESGRDAEALACLEAFPDAHLDADRRTALGVLNLRLGRLAAAESHFERALAATPEAPLPLLNLGVLKSRTGRPREAEQAYRGALAADPDLAAAHANLGLLLEADGRFDEALRHHEHAVRSAPDSAPTLDLAASLYARLGREAEAEALYRRAIERDPGYSIACSNLGVLCFDADRFDEAEALFRRALALRPGSRAARLNLGQLLLATGRLREGWQWCEARYERENVATPGALPEFPELVGACRRWRGEPLAGRSLIVWPEQGHGDQIQFGRYLAGLRAQGPRRLTLVCSTPLVELMRGLDGPDEVIDLAAGRIALAGHDLWTPLLGLPHHARTDLASVPAPIPYLRAGRADTARWAQRLPSGGMRVGLVWRGNRLHENDADRSLPGLDTLAPLWRVPGVRFISLQKQAGEADAATPPSAQPLCHLGGAIDGFHDTAAILTGLDLLITVDSAPAHLAGALGTPCWVLLPAHRCDWRWLRGCEATPWYPGMRLFRQPRRGDWSAVVAAVAAALGERVAAQRRPRARG